MVDTADTGDEVLTVVVRGLQRVADLEHVRDGARLILEDDTLRESDLKVDQRSVHRIHDAHSIMILGTVNSKGVTIL